MSTILVKTDIMCSDCIEKVKPQLDKLVGEDNWSIDTKSPDKTLTVHVEPNMSAMDVIAAVQGAGYKAEVIS